MVKVGLVELGSGSHSGSDSDSDSGSDSDSDSGSNIGLGLRIELGSGLDIGLGSAGSGFCFWVSSIKNGFVIVSLCLFSLSLLSFMWRASLTCHLRHVGSLLIISQPNLDFSGSSKGWDWMWCLSIKLDVLSQQGNLPVGWPAGLHGWHFSLLQG